MKGPPTDPYLDAATDSQTASGIPLIGVMQRPRTAAWVTFGVLLGLSVLLVVGVFAPLWRPVFMGAVLAGALSGWFEKLAKRLKQRRVLAATIFTFAVVVLLLIPLVIILVVGIGETISAVAFVREALASGGTQELIERLPGSLQKHATWALEMVRTRTSDLDGQVSSGGQMALSVLKGAVAATSTVVFDVIMFLIAFFGFLTDGPRLVQWIEDISPLRNRQMGELFREFRKVSRSVLGSMTATAAVQAVAATIGYFIAGVPQALFFGMVTFLAAFIPSVGTGIIAVPIALLLLLAGKTFGGIFLIVWATLVVGLVDNLLKPILIKGDMHLHGGIVFFALVGGAIFFGPVGLILGPLAVTFFMSMIRLGHRDFVTSRH